MAKFPEPQAGLVISYSYLWFEEFESGQVEGRKDRPCAVILAVDVPDKASRYRKRVVVVPITHAAPRDPGVAVEIPGAVKNHLGLDSERSWVILDEINEFGWPGFDLRPIKGDDVRIDYGFLPPRLFRRLIEKFAEKVRGRSATPRAMRHDMPAQRISGIGSANG
jgi:mRNA-degrading endonuclease toxin of MazEF toxin-antitoxin module